MRYSELELKRIIDKDSNNMTDTDAINFNILNFIHCVHLNKQDFYKASFDSQYFGDIEMTFKKNPFSLIGHCRVNDKKNEVVQDYLFMENGFELLDNIIKTNRNY